MFDYYSMNIILNSFSVIQNEFKFSFYNRLLD